MEISLSFDIGASSTKVSFIGKGRERPIVTREFINAVLFTQTSEKFYAQEALQKVQDHPEKHSGSLVTNFYQLLHTSQAEFLNSDENYYTYTKVKSNSSSDRLTFKLNHTGTLITPEKCLTYFFSHIRRTMIEEIFSEYKADVKVRALVCIDDKSNYFERLLLLEVLGEAGFSTTQFVFRGHALAFLYTKLHNYLVNKKVLFMDIGYASTKLMLVSISPHEISIVDSHSIPIGIRDFDFEIYLHILSDLKAKCGMDHQKDKHIRFSIMNKMSKLKKAFSLNSPVILNLQSSLGSTFYDQFVKIDYAKYKSLNHTNFLKLKNEISEYIRNSIHAKGYYVDDFQVVGGGAKLKSFVRAAQKALEHTHTFDKMVNLYSCSQGALLQDDFKVDIFARLDGAVRFEFNVPGSAHGDIEAAEKMTERSVVIREGQRLSPNSIPNDSIADHLSEEHSIRDSQYPDINLMKEKKNLKTALIDEAEKPKESPIKPASLKNSSSKKIAVDTHEEPISVPVARTGFLYCENERVNLRNNLKRLELPTELKQDADKVELILTYAEPKGKYATRPVILRQKIGENFDAVNISLDSNLLLKPFVLEPSRKEKPIEIFKRSDFEVSKISRFDPPPQHRPEHTEIVINVDFKDNQSHHSHSSHGSCGSCHKKNPLVNATFFHIISDLVQDVCLLATGILLFFKPEWEIIDPILSLLIAIFILFFVIRYTYRLFVRLMETCPTEINYQKVLSQMLGIQGILEVHDLHIWDLGDRKFAATAHVVCNENKERVLRDTTLLFRKHSIYHTTVQIESPAGKKDELYINCDNNIDVKIDRS